MQVKTALEVRHQGDIPGRRGVVDGQTYQTLIGVGDRPTDRVRIGRASYAPGTLEPLHWHPIEALYYVISGDATVRGSGDRSRVVGVGVALHVSSLDAGFVSSGKGS